MDINVIGFDADDTLWESQVFYDEAENKLAGALAPWADSEKVCDQLTEFEIENLSVFGYGAKTFTIAMIDTAIHVSNGEFPISQIPEIINWGKDLQTHPVDLRDGVVDALYELNEKYKLVLITKGELWQQELKIVESGLADLFEGIEILAEKSPNGYETLLKHARIDPKKFVMVGNSLRSDILPVLAIGSQAVHVPAPKTWSHEDVDVSNSSYWGQSWQEVRTIRHVPSAVEKIRNM